MYSKDAHTWQPVCNRTLCFVYLQRLYPTARNRHQGEEIYQNLWMEWVLLLLSLCAASRIWVRHRSVVILPPEVFEISVGLGNVLMFYSCHDWTSLGNDPNICDRVMYHARILLPTRNSSTWELFPCGLRLKEGDAKSVNVKLAASSFLLIDFLFLNCECSSK